MADDAELLKAYAETGCEGAFTELVHRHLKLVYLAALRRTGGDSHQAQDVAQEVFVSVARNARRLAKHPCLTGWLYSSTRNAAVAAARANNRRLARQGEALRMLQANTPVRSESEWARLRPMLDSVLDSLPARDRDAVLLYFFEGRSYREIGRHLGCGEDAARMRAARALERIKVLFRRHGLTSTTAALAACLTSESSLAVPAGLAPIVAKAALAGSAAAAAHAGTMFGFFKFMTATKAAIGVLTVTCILSIGTAIFEARRAERATLALAAAAAGPAKSVLKAAAPAPASVAVSAGPEAVAAPPPNDVVQARAGAGASQHDPRLSPAPDLVQRRDRMRLIQRQYGYAFAKLNLPPERLAKLKALLLERISARGDAGDVAAQAGLAGQEVETAQHEAESSITEEIKGLVGDEGYAALLASVKASEYTPLVANSVGMDLDAAGVPLSREQTAALAELFASRDPVRPPAAAQQAPDPRTGLTPFYQSMLDEVSKTLTPEQLPVVKNYFLELEQLAQSHQEAGQPG